MKFYRYLYFNLYQLWLKKKDEPENAHINAVITISFLLYVNIISIPLIFLAASKNEIINLPQMNVNAKIWIAVILVSAGIFNYFLLARKRQHNKIIEEFKSESKERRKKGTAYTIFYLIVSFLIPLYIFFFTTPK
ncbi:hypothetical protein QA597_11975 [Marinilabiliaceae bacterium ANBcel2]|nr:hypothetical protein [Marinilabiliaceae bacterium ANBcel2]